MAKFLSRDINLMGFQISHSNQQKLKPFYDDPDSMLPDVAAYASWLVIIFSNLSYIASIKYVCPITMSTTDSNKGFG